MVVAGENTAFGCFDERDKFTYFGEIRHFGFRLGDCVGHIQPVAEEDIVQIFDGADCFRRETVAAHTDDIETANAAVASVTDHERGQVHGNGGTA